MRRPAAHYEEVASLYQDVVSGRVGTPVPGTGVARPLVVIAERYGVPRTTAAAWVKEARRRGILRVPAWGPR